jgi:hypothetical protein
VENNGRKKEIEEIAMIKSQHALHFFSIGAESNAQTSQHTQQYSNNTFMQYPDPPFLECIRREKHHQQERD